MNDLFKNFWNKIECKKNGICAINPVSKALEAFIVNEIRQTAFFITKLKELDLINEQIIQETVFALSLSILDLDFDRDNLKNLFVKLENSKKKVKDFYIKKTKEAGGSYEFISPVLQDNLKINDVNDFIKNGETIIKHFYISTKKENARLINLIMALCKESAISLMMLSKYKKPDINYFLEILRLISLTNYTGTRKEKLIRRIKEFSEISFQIKKELSVQEKKKYGEMTGGIIKTGIKKGKCILVVGCDLIELYEILEKTKNEDINIYLGVSMIRAFLYPKFREYKHLIGIFGTGDIEYDFSKFKGAIYVTEHSNIGLDGALRGSIFTSRTICSKKSRQINGNSFDVLTEECKKLEGYDEDIKGAEIEFKYELPDEILMSEDKILISEGIVNEKNFPDYKVINFPIPNDFSFILEAINKRKGKELSVCFSNCSQEIIGIIGSILSKNISEIYIKNCPLSDINPHIIDSFKEDFNIKTQTE